MKKNIIIMFGGKSPEHDISIITGIQALENIDRTFYNVRAIYVSRGGVMFSGDALEHIEFFQNFNSLSKQIREVSFIVGKPYIMFKHGKVFKKPWRVDCAILCHHGVNGEDGSVQGVLSLCDIPFTSPSIECSAVCMNKITMKAVLGFNNFPIVKHFSIAYSNKNDFESLLNKHEMSYPIIIKPAKLGSSIGISKCETLTEAKKGLEVAFSFDNQVVVETAITNLKEVNCAVSGWSGGIELSSLEEPVSKEKILSFQEKYLNGIKDGQTKALYDDEIEISNDLKSQIKSLSSRAFRTFGASGVIRIDFLIDMSESKVYLNELNTIPGSLSAHLFCSKHYTFSMLIDDLIANAFREKACQDRILTSYQSTAILDYINNKDKVRPKLKI